MDPGRSCSKFADVRIEMKPDGEPEGPLLIGSEVEIPNLYMLASTRTSAGANKDADAGNNRRQANWWYGLILGGLQPRRAPGKIKCVLDANVALQGLVGVVFLHANGSCCRVLARTGV